jgi:hypothetical protein
MGLTWEVPPEQAFEALATAYTSAIHRGVVIIYQRWAPEIANWMKENAPWTDRTGNARQGLYTAVENVVNTMVELIMSHGVEYGIFLELKNAGHFAIVNPALDYFAPKIWQDVRELVSR